MVIDLRLLLRVLKDVFVLQCAMLENSDMKISDPVSELFE